ncbi:hypothetical protein [Paenibacillus sp. PAMC21692]|uniref:hypothetical protein n=1 Tax=Paenibacillus sp. PAMC21692 TaxID=2762320 RepID=UPI00164DB126|nr:hypothetical protein [Paenibacillus sp. PAMC21692]QNK56290.1 hypothetical protein H7F31_27670 [Paenibacillus sp. PAMC21692]
MINAPTGLYSAVAEPCRNFNILGMIVIIDPMDGREKFILSNYVEGSTGNLVIIDTETGEGEELRFPGDSGAWGILYLDRYERLQVSTCESYGYLLSLDLKTRTWAKPLKDENELYIWNITLGSDGMVYGGTYPGCVLLRYDPEHHTLENLGRVSDNPLDQYSRTVYGEVPGHIVIKGGYDTPFLRAYNIDSGSLFEFGNQEAEIRQITDEFICTEFHGDFEFFDPGTFARISGERFIEQLELHKVALADNIMRETVKLASGKLAGVRGQEYFVFDPGTGQTDLRRIPVPAPPTTIHELTSDEDGRIWGRPLSVRRYLAMTRKKAAAGIPQSFAMDLEKCTGCSLPGESCICPPIPVEIISYTILYSRGTRLIILIPRRSVRLLQSWSDRQAGRLSDRMAAYGRVGQRNTESTAAVYLVSIQVRMKCWTGMIPFPVSKCADWQPTTNICIL